MVAQLGSDPPWTHTERFIGFAPTPSVSVSVLPAVLPITWSHECCWASTPGACDGDSPAMGSCLLPPVHRTLVQSVSTELAPAVLAQACWSAEPTKQYVAWMGTTSL